MKDFSMPSAASLSAAIDQQIAQLPDAQMPSLRILQSANLVEVDYEILRSQKLVVSSPDGKEVDADEAERAMSWIRTVQSTLAPGGVTLLRARVVQSPEPIHSLSANYLAITALAVSLWPHYRSWPQGLSLGAYLKLNLEDGDGESRLCPTVRLGGGGLEIRKLKAFMADLDDVQARAQHYWSRCAFKIGSWLADGGITEIEFVIPFTPPSGLPTYKPPRPATALH